MFWGGGGASGEQRPHQLGAITTSKGNVLPGHQGGARCCPGSEVEQVDWISETQVSSISKLQDQSSKLLN